MKFPSLVVTTLLLLQSSSAFAGAVHDSIDCIAKGKVTCGMKSLKEEKEEEIESVHYNGACVDCALQDKRKPGQAEVEETEI